MKGAKDRQTDIKLKKKLESVAIAMHSNLKPPYATLVVLWL